MVGTLCRTSLVYEERDKKAHLDTISHWYTQMVALLIRQLLCLLLSVPTAEIRVKTIGLGETSDNQHPVMGSSMYEMQQNFLIAFHLNGSVLIFLAIYFAQICWVVPTQSPINASSSLMVLQCRHRLSMAERTYVILNGETPITHPTRGRAFLFLSTGDSRAVVLCQHMLTIISVYYTLDTEICTPEKLSHIEMVWKSKHLTWCLTI